MSIIRLENVSKFYKSGDGVSVGMQKVSLDFKLGEFVAITGESGSGKSTLLNVISGLDSYEDGELYIQNEETSHFLVKDWENYRSKYIGFIFQNYNIIDSFTVYENVLLALEVQNYPRKLRKKRALELIDKVGLTSHKNHKASKLSGGQKQRAVIARALAKDTPIIVADEPTGNLDSESSKQVINLLKELSKDKLIIIVTHDYDQVKDIASRHIKMHDGEVVEDKRLKTTTAVDNLEAPNPKSMTTLSVARFALRNLLSRPRLLIFFVALQVMIIMVFTMVYSNVMNAARGNIFNIDTGYYGTEYFDFVPNNISENRMNVVRKDGQDMTQSDYNTLRGLSGGNHYVYEGVLDMDLLNGYSLYYYDSDGYSTWLGNNVAFDTSYHIQKQPQFLISGTFSSLAADEVIVSNAINVEIGDILYSSGMNMIDEFITIESIENDVYKIPDHIYNSINLVRVYWIAYFNDDTETSIMSWGNMFDFAAYLTSEELDKVESYAARIVHENYAQEEYVVAGIYNDNHRQAIYFAHEHQQPLGIKTASLSSSSAITAKRLFDSIDKSVYRVIYPENEQDALAGYFAPLNFVVSLFFYAFIYMFALFLYFILYSVMKNVMSSRRKDFAIFRSIGTNESKLGILVIFEQVFMMTISFIISLILINVLSYSNYSLQIVLEQLQSLDYIILFFTFTYLSIWLARRFNKKTFKISVIENLTESREDTL